MDKLDKTKYTEQDDKGFSFGFISSLFGGFVFAMLIYAIIYNSKTPSGRKSFIDGALTAFFIGLVLIAVILLVVYVIANNNQLNSFF